MDLIIYLILDISIKNGERITEVKILWKSLYTVQY